MTCLSSSAQAPTDQELDFAERVGRYYEHDGLPYPRGKVLGHLIVCDPPEQTAAEISEALGIDRKPIDRVSGQLAPAHLLARRELDDGEYALRLGDEAWPQVVTHTFASWPALRDVLRRGLDQVPDEPAGRLERLVGIERMYSYLCDRMPAIVERIDLGGGRGVELTPVPPIEPVPDDGWNASGRLSEGERTFVDDFATYYERNDGMPRARGRIIGWLIISVPLRQKVADLQEIVGATDEDVDFIVSLLSPSGVVVTGNDPDCDDAIWMDEGAWPARMKHVFANIPRFYEVLADGREVLADTDFERRRRVEGLAGLFGSLSRDIPQLLAEMPATEQAR